MSGLVAYKRPSQFMELLSQPRPDNKTRLGATVTDRGNRSPCRHCKRPTANRGKVCTKCLNRRAQVARNYKECL